MESLEELEAVCRRVAIVRHHLDGKNKTEIARELDTTRPTVRKWIDQFEEEGVQGLMSGSSPGRPPEVHPIWREEMVRLPQESRPPIDLGDQWTTRTLAEAFRVSSSYVSKVWREAGFDPPQHVQQVEHQPDRRVRLQLDVDVPAWLKLHLELSCMEQDQTMEERLLESLVGPDGPEELRAKVLSTLRRRWTDANEQLPREDPRQPAYRLSLARRVKDAG